MRHPLLLATKRVQVAGELAQRLSVQETAPSNLAALHVRRDQLEKEDVHCG